MYNLIRMGSNIAHGGFYLCNSKEQNNYKMPSVSYVVLFFYKNHCWLDLHKKLYLLQLRKDLWLKPECLLIGTNISVQTETTFL